MSVPRPLLLALTCALLSVRPAISAERGITAEFTTTSLVLVPLYVNGRGPHHFVLDTGATTTMLDSTLASELLIQSTGTIEIVTSAGTFSAPAGFLDELAVGTLRMSPVAVSWMALDELRRDDSRIVGVLGQDILAQRTVSIDYVRRRIELTTSPCRDGDTMVDVAWAHGRPMVTISVRAPGLPSIARLVLDSAANALVLFAARQAGARATSVRTHGAAAAVDVIPRVQIAVGGVRRAGPAVTLPSAAMRDETGLLPTAWFSRVCIDGPRSRAMLTL